MKHQTIEQLQHLAEIHPQRPVAMSRAERLHRWAELLERRPERCLSTLAGTEHQRPAKRASMRSDGSPLTVAFEDPRLRAAGLRDDSYGEAKRFFELDDWQLHDVVCHCHFGETMKAATAARGVRAAIAAEKGLLARLRHAIFG